MNNKQHNMCAKKNKKRKRNINAIIKEKSTKYNIKIDGSNCSMNKGSSKTESGIFDLGSTTYYSCGGCYISNSGDTLGCRFHDEHWICDNCKKKEGRLNRLNAEINKRKHSKKE